jgi:hypothetical protein
MDSGEKNELEMVSQYPSTGVAGKTGRKYKIESQQVPRRKIDNRAEFIKAIYQLHRLPFLQIL